MSLTAELLIRRVLESFEMPNFEFDKNLNDYYAGRSDEYWSSVMYNTVVDGRHITTVPMSQLATLCSIVDFQPELIERIFEKIGTPYKKEEFAERIDKVVFPGI